MRCHGAGRCLAHVDGSGARERGGRGPERSARRRVRQVAVGGVVGRSAPGDEPALESERAPDESLHRSGFESDARGDGGGGVRRVHLGAPSSSRSASPATSRAESRAPPGCASRPASTPDHEAHNLGVFEDFLAKQEDGADYVLNKIQGVGHGGGVQVAAGTPEFEDMERFLGLLGEEVSSTPLTPQTLFDTVTMAPTRKTLRRAALIFAGRIPTDAEYAGRAGRCGRASLAPSVA